MLYNRTKILEIFDIFDIGQRVEQINLARKKFMLDFAIGIILSKNVHHSAVVIHFDPSVKTASHIRRAERFFNAYELDYIQIAILLMCFLPPGRIHLAIDRTNWKFGKHNINFLALTAYCKGVGIPLFFELLDKRGNSNTRERKKLLRQLLRILPPKQIASFTADREFIGNEWYNFLIINKIPFYIRIKSDTRIEYNGVKFHAARFALGKNKRCFENIRIHRFRLHLATKLIGYEVDKEDRYLLILTNANVEKAISLYRNRWSIEVFFQSLKKRGFNLENTHMTDLGRLKKLFALVSIAFCICLKAGVYKHQKIKPLRKKKNGYKSSSFFRYGLDYMRKALLHFLYFKNRILDFLEVLVNELHDNAQMWANLNFILKL